jgi:hypothetical protein
VIVSNTFKKSAMHLSNIKKELIENAMLNDLFKGITVPRDAEGDSIFRHPDGFETWVLCKGVDQIPSIRGVKHGADRPDLMIGDDMEDDELVMNPDRRKKLQEDFDTALIPAGQSGACQYIFVGTILHDDSQLSKLVSRDKYKEYKKLFYEGHIAPDTDNERSLWDEKWTVPYLRQLRKDKPNVYAKEIQNNPVAGLNTRFKQEDFRYWKIENNDYILMAADSSPVSRNPLRMCRAAVSCDLAWQEKRSSDASVILPGLLTPDSELLIMPYVHERGLRPDKLAEYLFEIVSRLESLTASTVPVGFEKAMLENVSQWLLKREMKKRNKFLMTKELVWDHDKNTRIETRLQPRYSQRVIYHQEGMGELEHQLLRFPYGAFDDLIDAEQGLIQLLQNPKEKSKQTEPEDEFMWWRKQAIHMRTKPTKRIGQFLVKKVPIEIPAKKSWR